MKKTVFAILVGFSTLSLGQKPEAGDRGLLPLQPKQLLAALPKAREEWTLKKSIASNDVDEWLISKAERLFEFLPPEEGAQPALARISVIDTAKQGSSVEMFAKFKEGEVKDGIEGLTIEGMPAYRSAYGPIVKLKLFVNSRFVLEVLLKNQQEEELQEWLKLCDVSKLRATDLSVVPFPKEMTIHKIDELNPKKSYSYQMSMSTAKEIERQLIEEEKLLKD